MCTVLPWHGTGTAGMVRVRTNGTMVLEYHWTMARVPDGTRVPSVISQGMGHTRTYTSTQCTIGTMVLQHTYDNTTPVVCMA